MVAGFVAADVDVVDLAVVAVVDFFATGFLAVAAGGVAGGVVVCVVESCAEAAVTASPNIAIPIASFDMGFCSWGMLRFDVEDVKRLCQSDHINFHEYIFRQP